MDDGISFGYGEKVALHFAADSEWSVRLLEPTFVSARWTGFLGLEEYLVVGLNGECCLCSSVEIAEGELIPHPWFGPHEDMFAPQHRSTIGLVQVIPVLSLQVTQASPAPMMCMSLCCDDVVQERGEVNDPSIVPLIFSSLAKAVSE